MLTMMMALAMAQPSAAQCPVKQTPLVMAHRGASADRPEQTLEAFAEAIDQGADYLELDVVPTKDKILIVRHENELSGTTDIASRPEFASRKTTKTIEGNQITGWFSEDMTLAEIRTLRARERLPELRPASARYDGLFQVPTMEEVIKLAQAKQADGGKTVGLYPELKHAAYFASIGQSTEDPLLKLLGQYGYDKATDPVILHSFEVGVLESLHKKTKLRIMQIVGAGGGPADKPGTTYAQMTSPAGLKAIKRYAVGINTDALLAFPGTAQGNPTPGPVIGDAHKAGLDVYIWTIRPENQFLPKPLWNGTTPAGRGNMNHVVDALIAAGADGIVTDAPGLTRAQLERRGCTRG